MCQNIQQKSKSNDDAELFSLMMVRTRSLSLYWSLRIFILSRLSFFTILLMATYFPFRHVLEEPRSVWKLKFNSQEIQKNCFVKFLQQLNSFLSVKPHHSFCWGKKSVCWKADRSSKEAEKCFATAGDKELWTIEEWKWKPSSPISFIRQTLKEFATNHSTFT